MRKKLSTVLLLYFAILHTSFATTLIEDDFAIRTLSNKSITKPQQQKEIIEDDLIKNLDKNIFKKPKQEQTIIEDEAKITLTNTNYTKQTPNTDLIYDNIEDYLRGKNYQKQMFQKTPIQDPDITKLNNYPPKQLIVKYKIIDEKSPIVKITLRPQKNITSESDIKIGDKIIFITKEDIQRGDKVFLPKGTEFFGTIENITQPDRFGDPSEIEIGNIQSKDTKGSIIELDGQVRKEGTNRAKWVKPLYYIGINGGVFGTPLMAFYFVKGGKAELKTQDEFFFYYE